MNIKHIFLILVVVMMLFTILPCYTLASNTPENELSERELRIYATEHQTWVLSDQQGSRNSDFYQYDATDTRLYFSYSEYSCVDVYDLEGTFLYSLVFPNRENGSVNVRCENNLAYISSKDNILYIFSDRVETENMDYDTARKEGYDFYWFNENDPSMTVDDYHISWYDESGALIKQIQTPSVIQQTMPPSKELGSAIPIIILALALYLFIFHFLKRRA